MANCKACSSPATNGVYCKYHRTLYNERVAEMRARRQKNGRCVLCDAPLSPESTRHCTKHMVMEEKRSEKDNPDLALRGALLKIFQEKRMPKKDLVELRQMIKSTTQELDFRVQLDEKEVWVLFNRLIAINPVSLRESGAKLGISYEWVRKIEQRVGEKLQNYLVSKNIIKEDGTIVIGQDM